MIYEREIRHFSKLFNDGPLILIDGLSGPQKTKFSNLKYFHHEVKFLTQIIISKET